MYNRGFRLSRAVSLSSIVRSVLAIAVVAASSVGVRAQAGQTAPVPSKAPADETLPSARSIIDHHIQAVGGRKAILAHSSSHASGTVMITGSGLNGTFDVFSAKPDRSLLKISIGGIGEIAEGFDGTVAWSLSPMTGPMLNLGKELEQRKFDSDFYSELHDSVRYASIKTIEKTTFEGRPCYKISLVKKDGGEDFDFYDVATGLKAGAIVTRETPMGPVTQTQVQSDYKKFGDMLQPATVKSSAMGVQQVLTITALEYDAVALSVFEAPPQIKALIK
jgi:hypothetical protein